MNVLRLALVLILGGMGPLVWGQVPTPYWYAPQGGPQPPAAIPTYTKVELGLSLDTTWARARDRYAFDGIDGWLTGPQGQQRRVLLFYYEPLRYGAVGRKLVYGNYRVEAPSAAVWRPAEGPEPQHHWRMRLVLDAPGRWQLQLRRRIGGERRPWGAPIVLQAVPSERLAPLAFDPGGRYLRDARGNMTFLLGHNVAYYTNETMPTPYADRHPSGDKGYARNTRWQYEHYLDQISNHGGDLPGGNYARILLTPWTFDLEVDSVGNYDACQNRAFDLDQVVELAAERGVYLHLVLYDHVFFNDHPDPARRFPYYHWGNHPYHTQLAGVEEVVDFFTDAEALALARQKLRYLVARYGYAPQWFCLELFNETDNFLGGNRRYYLDHQAEIDGWNVALAGYLDSLDTHLLATTGVMNATSAAAVWASPAIDFSSYHLYQALKNTHYFTHYLTQRLLRRHDKPTMLGEYGLHIYNDTGQLCGWDINDPDPASFSVMHNALWGGSFAGSFSAPLLWYYWVFHGHWMNPPGYLFYVPMRSFLAGEDLAGMQPLANACSRLFLPDFDRSSAAPDGCYPADADDAAYRIGGIYTSNDANLQVFALADSGRLLGWVHNKNHYWYDLRHLANVGDTPDQPCPSYNWPTGDSSTDAGLDPYRYPLYRETISLPVARPGRYRLEWWGTYPTYDYAGDGQPQSGPGRIEAWTDTLQVASRTATFRIPPLVALARGEGPQAPDYGFKLIWLGP